VSDFSPMNLTLSIAVDPASLFSSEKCSELILNGLIRKDRKKTDRHVKFKLDRGIAWKKFTELN